MVLRRMFAMNEYMSNMVSHLSNARGVSPMMATYALFVYIKTEWVHLQERKLY